MQDVKKGLQAVRRYSTRLLEQKVPVSMFPEINACWDMGKFSFGWILG
jgi:hypothetical protein